MNLVTFNFSEALNKLKEWEKITRDWWNWQEMHLVLQIPDENSKMTMPYIYINIPLKDDEEWLEYNRVPWLASQTDLLESDWIIF